MTNWNKISEILIEVTTQMGGDADTINNGDCAVWAKRSFDSLLESKLLLGIEELEIVNNLSEEMEDELEGYETIGADYPTAISHCYVKVDGWFFDAFDIDGVEEEEDMEFHIKCL